MALQKQGQRGQTRGQSQQGNQQLQNEVAGYGSLEVPATALPTTILARVGNENVTLIAFGDIKGHSPSYLCIDDSGASNWVSMGEVQIIDARVLPLTPELMGRIQDQLNRIGQ